MKKKTAFFLLGAFFLPLFAQASGLQFSVWIPYWKKMVATSEVKNNLDSLYSVSPFSFEVTAEGKIRDAMKINEEPWVDMLAMARAQKVKIIPSILWTDGGKMDQVFRKKSLREAHVGEILSLVVAGNYDGIDIDYENKKASTYYGFSAFLRLLSTKLHAQNKILVCTIEPRFSPTSKYREVPTDIQYANNYIAINKYCDEVRIMTYEQTTADWKLADQKTKLGYYTPLADKAWVSKVVVYTGQEIDRSKMVLGVVNYGYEYEVSSNGSPYSYKRIRSVSYKTAKELAMAQGVVPVRNSAGEMSFTYQKDGKTRLVWYSDAQAISDKVALAKKLGLKGVVLFRIDGESESKMWEVLK